MRAIGRDTLAAVTGGAYGDSVTQDPQYQRDLLECWDKAGNNGEQAACVNAYYDKFWANRENPPTTEPPPPRMLEFWKNRPK